MQNAGEPRLAGYCFAVSRAAPYNSSKILGKAAKTNGFTAISEEAYSHKYTP
jgi:hypothetical protein